MAKRGREAFTKRAKERERQERADAKRERRNTRSDAATTPSPDDEVELMERFARLSRRFEANELAPEEFVEERGRIFDALGIAPPEDQP